MVMTTIQPMSATAVTLDKDAVLRVTDLEGHQVADLVAFNAADVDEYFSQGCTRAYNDKASVQVGDHLYSNLDAPMLTVVKDTVGVHDLLFMPCSKFLYQRVFGVENKTGCREHLTSALEGYDIGWDRVTDPFNVFMNTAIDEHDRMRIFTAPSEAGDYLDLRAEMDLIVAVSACAADVSDCNGGVCTSIGIEVLAAATQ